MAGKLVEYGGIKKNGTNDEKTLDNHVKKAGNGCKWRQAAWQLRDNGINDGNTLDNHGLENGGKK